ncbi:unnamed protein product [Ilex paraguariensis]|uniref:LOB domain-containing protein n=1 Tax=Ilex paraguariensis TaxID=185542 RepID=A0ABC8SHV3_9AQUA
MSCNGCRVLRRGCSDSCVLRSCLEWIDNPQAQANATLFVSKFFGRSDLMAFISGVPHNKRPACGRTVNPVNGAIGLLSTGNWHVCQSAVETVLSGGILRPLVTGILTPNSDEASEVFRLGYTKSTASMHVSDQLIAHQPSDLKIPLFGTSYPPDKWLNSRVSLGSDVSEVSMGFETGDDGVKKKQGGGGEEPKLLNLFA